MGGIGCMLEKEISGFQANGISAIRRQASVAIVVSGFGGDGDDGCVFRAGILLKPYYGNRMPDHRTPDLEPDEPAGDDYESPRPGFWTVDFHTSGAWPERHQRRSCRHC